MKAIVWTAYGSPDVLQLKDVEKPTPKDDEILVKILATTVTAGDCEIRSLSFPFYLALMMRLWVGLLKPKENTIIGTEIAGVVEALGEKVTKFNIGDHVFGAAGMKFGACAEYICLPEEPGDMDGSITTKPSNMTHAEAVTVPFGGRDTLHFLRKAGLREGQSILINGAGGSIGTFAVQLAKHVGATVTAVDSADKLNMLSTLGADHVIDYLATDFTSSGQRYDVIFDVVGKAPFFRSLKSLKDHGYLVLANPRLRHILCAMLASMFTNKTVITETAKGTVADLVYFKELIEAGNLTTVIDRSYPIEQIAEAHRYVETGRKLGNVVITIG